MDEWKKDCLRKLAMYHWDDEIRELYLHKVRSELERELSSIADGKIDKKISELHWKYGSVIGAVILSASIFGYSQISDIPEKIELALASETTLNTIDKIKEKGRQVDEAHTSSFILLRGLEDNYKNVTEDIANNLKQDFNFQKRIKGEKGDQGLPGESGQDGINGINGKDGNDGTDGKDGEDGKDGINGKDGVYADILSPEEVGVFDVVKSQGKVILTFSDRTKNESIEYVNFVIGPGFEDQVVSPSKNGNKFTYTLSVKNSFEAIAIVFYKNDSKRIATPYLFNVRVNP